MAALVYQMIRKEFYKIIFTSIYLIAALLTAAQSGTTVKATVDKNQILIGEPIQLRLEVNIPESESIRFFSLDSIPHFEFLEAGKTDTVNTSSGTRITRIIPITSFDSGHWVIPSFSLAENLQTDTIPVDVGFSAFNPEQPYHDIKDIIEVDPPKKKQQWWWYVAGAGVILLILIIYLLTRKKPVVAAVPKSLVNPYEEAMKQIAALERNKPEAKQYYSELTDIFRLYVFRKKGILSLQKTMDDMMIQLKGLNMKKESFDQLSQALRLSDFVKFAKYIPGPEDDTIVLNAIKRSIQEIEQIS